MDEHFRAVPLDSGAWGINSYEWRGDVLHDQLLTDTYATEGEARTEAKRLSCEKSARNMDDRTLLAEYRESSGTPGEPEVEALLAEIERRNLDL